MIILFNNSLEITTITVSIARYIYSPLLHLSSLIFEVLSCSDQPPDGILGSRIKG